MGFIKKLKIRSKLFFAFFVILAITIFISVFGGFAMREIDASYSNVINYNLRRRIILGDIAIDLMDMRRVTTRIVANAGLAEDVTASLNQLERDVQRLRADIVSLIGEFRENLQNDPLYTDTEKQKQNSQMDSFQRSGVEFIDTYVSQVLIYARAGDLHNAYTKLNSGIVIIEEGQTHLDAMRAFTQNYGDELNTRNSAHALSTFWTLIILSAIGVVLGLVIGVFIAGLITVPVASLSKALGEVAQGDLTKRLVIDGEDEVAAASVSFNTTMEEFSKLIASIKAQSGALSKIGTSLASNMAQTASAVNEITANIQSIKGRVVNQSASVTETSATMEQVSGNIGKLNTHVERQTEAIARSASALEQMIANIQSVNATLAKNAVNVKGLQASSESGRVNLQEVLADIHEVSRESEGLMEINSVMSNIASQTNLLSMNAAIEAAHAGEAGRGFAVVADEIRKLAESSGAQSKTIGNVLKKIHESINKISKSTDRVMTGFEVIDQSVKTVAEQEEIIRNAMQEQNEGSKQILQSSGTVSEITHEVKSGSTEMLEGSKEVIAEGKNLQRLTQEITDGMNEMAVGTEQVNQAVNTVNDMSGKTSESIDVLVRSVSQFKV